MVSALEVSTQLILRAVLSPAAERSIRGFFHGDGYDESGGYLLGDFAGSDAVVGFAHESSTIDRSRSHIRFMPEEMEAVERAYEMRILGDWHYHPGDPGPFPSAQDRESWENAARVVGHPWLGIVVGDNDTPYYPVGAWVAKQVSGGWHTARILIGDQRF